MQTPDNEREALYQVLNQAETDLAEAHKMICKLQGLDPATQTWPEWSSPAHSLPWFAAIRAKFDLGRPVPPHGSGP